MIGSADLGVDLGATVTGQICPFVPVTTFTATNGANRTYLRGDWCGAATDRVPVGRIIFGVK